MRQHSQVEQVHKTSWNRWKPAVDRRWLLLTAGVMWSGVGIMLSRLALGWLSDTPVTKVCPFILAGMLLASAIWGFGFSRLARKNVTRIMNLNRKACFFAFQQWTSYIIVVVMMTMGKMMRQLPIPRTYLASMYLGIGGALFLGSLAYYRRLLIRQKDTPA